LRFDEHVFVERVMEMPDTRTLAGLKATLEDRVADYRVQEVH